MGQGSESRKNHQEMTMNAFVATVTRDVTCAAASLALTLFFTAAFVQSTSVPWNARAQATRMAVAHAAAPSWFGQPKPAVLVD
jgi:hypothetical protein